MAKIEIYSNYNTYFNRRLVFEDPSNYMLVYSDNVNFNPNDGINTVFVAGKEQKPYKSSGNYAFVTDGDKITHWFILESKRIRGGQYKLTLRRDLLRDFQYEWAFSTAKINRCILPENSPYIFNSEDVELNQIKTSETLLKDDTGSAWIVGFVDQSMDEDIVIDTKSAIIPDYEYSSIEEIPGYKAFDKYIFKKESIPNFSELEFYIYFGIYKEIGSEAESNNHSTYRSIYNRFNKSYSDSTSPTYLDNYPSNYYIVKNTDGEEAAYNDFVDYCNSEYNNIEDGVNNNKESLILNALQPNYILVSDKYSGSGYAYNNVISEEEYNFLFNFKSGQIIKITGTGDAKYYRITQLTIGTSFNSTFTEGDTANIINNRLSIYLRHNGSKAVYCAKGIKSTGVVFGIEEVETVDTKITFPSAKNRYNNKTAPFDMFIIPYSDNLVIKANDKEIKANRLASMTLSTSLAVKLDKRLYDLQLLPYCPITGYEMETQNTLKLIDSTDKRINFFYENEETPGADVNPVSCLIWSTSSSGTKNIELKNPITISNKKISNSCDMYRLVSPNYNGQFEFSPAKNGGVKSINVDFTYLPYSSYIHLNPDFGELYGSDFNDARGLICQGDFSIMYLSDAWVSFQLQNKNYNAIFDRGIQNLEVNRKYERIEQGASVAGSALSAGVKTGIMTGNGLAGIGAGLTSAAVGAADIHLSEQLYKEKISYSKDLQALQLGNIKALPNSIAKTTAYTENNKIFPILEYYTCTESEKISFAELISNYSMNAGFIDVPEHYITNKWEYKGIQSKGFFSAEIIQIFGVEEDDNVISEIAKELRLGVYLK